MQPSIQRAGGISLSQLLPECQVLSGEDVRVSSCCSDSRRCREGDLFVALVGSNVDGHDHVREAVARGARAVLAERYVPTDATVCLVEDTREAYGRLCQALSNDPSQLMSVYGVTGTVGKTVTCMLLASIMEAAGKYAGVTSSIGYSDSVKQVAAARTTPAAPELANWLARMSANGCAAGIVELSSDALAQRRTAGVGLDAAVLTNVRRDHLDRHGTLLNYRNAKFRIFDHLKPNGFAVINVDDPVSSKLLEKMKGPVMTIGIENSAELTATVVEQHAGEQIFMLTAGQETAAVRTRMIGQQHVYNCLSAAAVGLVSGVDFSDVVRGLEAVEYVPGRMQPLACGQPFQVYVDFARSSDALALCLSTVRKLTAGRVICVFGSAGEQEQDRRAPLGRVAERMADVNVITSTDPHYERPLDIANDILDGYERPAKARLIPDRNRAIEWALNEARPGDSVVIAGKGHETFQLVNGRRQPLDDVETARNWLHEVGAAKEFSTVGSALPATLRRFLS